MRNTRIFVWQLQRGCGVRNSDRFYLVMGVLMPVATVALVHLLNWLGIGGGNEVVVVAVAVAMVLIVRELVMGIRDVLLVRAALKSIDKLEAGLLCIADEGGHDGV